MKIGIIGYGSIGKRHARNLRALGNNEIILLRELGNGNDYGFLEIKDVNEFMSLELDVIIISNPTNMHFDYLSLALSKNVHILVEKPVVSNSNELSLIKNKLEKYSAVGMTAYNMRFHPCIIEIENQIKENKIGKIFSARLFVGQFLPDWRPERKYEETYSAKKIMGGGVIFDLIHEIDLAYLLFGKPLSPINNLIDKVSRLDIDVEDMVELLYKTSDNKFISIHLDYLSKYYNRYIEIIGENCNIYANLFTNEIKVYSQSKMVYEKDFPNFNKNDMYMDLMSSFLNSIRENNMSPIPISEGLISNQIAIELREKYYGEQ